MREQRQHNYNDEDSRSGRGRDEQHWERPRNERGEFERFRGGDMDRDRESGGDWRTQGDGQYMDSWRGRGESDRQSGQFGRDEYGSSYGNQGGYGRRDDSWSGSAGSRSVGGQRGYDEGSWGGGSGQWSGSGGQGNGGRMGRGEYGRFGEPSLERGDRSGMSSQQGSSQRSYGGYTGPAYGQGGNADRSWRDESSMDRSESGYAGKGPKNYQRSDDRIREDVCDRLTDDHRIDASEIAIEVRSGEITLTGTVQDREQKRRAEDVVEQVSGVQNVTNNLRVSKGERDRSSERSTSSSGRPDGSFGSMESGNKSKSQSQTRQ